jgi:pyruvate dehydrogenase E2 component (dihydrolipoamide acetyltransferase)
MAKQKANCKLGMDKTIKIRRLIAKKMEEAWLTIPHFHVSMSVDMTDVIRLRTDLGMTINDFILGAASHALQEHPWVNSVWNGEQGVEVAHIGLAMAVATDCGLYYPVIKDCRNLSLKQISQSARELAAKAHKGCLTDAERSDATFTVTNMGMLGVESFAAIITPPQAAVLSVGTVKGEVVVDEQGEPGVAPIMRMTLGADHRLLDGADAAEFLATIKSYLEAPVMLDVL